MHIKVRNPHKYCWLLTFECFMQWNGTFFIFISTHQLQEFSYYLLHHKQCDVCISLQKIITIHIDILLKNSTASEIWVWIKNDFITFCKGENAYRFSLHVSMIANYVVSLYTLNLATKNLTTSLHVLLWTISFITINLLLCKHLFYL